MLQVEAVDECPLTVPLRSRSMKRAVVVRPPIMPPARLPSAPRLPMPPEREASAASIMAPELG